MVFICLKDLSESLSPPKKGEFLPPTQKAAGLPVAPPLSPAAPPLLPAVPCTGRALSAQTWRPSLLLSLRLPGDASPVRDRLHIV